METQKREYKMTKQHIKTYLMFAIGMFTGMSLVKLTSNNDTNSETTRTKVDFVFNGIKYDKTFNSLSFDTAIYSTNPYLPSFINKSGIIRNDTLAFQIASILLYDIYGKDNIKRQFPAQVSLINDSVWHVTGNLPQDGKSEGGTFNIWIDKFQGKVLHFTHEK